MVFGDTSLLVRTVSGDANRDHGSLWMSSLRHSGPKVMPPVHWPVAKNRAPADRGARLSRLVGECAFQLCTERAGIDRRVSVQLRLDRVEEAAQLVGRHDTAPQH
jgi:hypothetical protein